MDFFKINQNKTTQLDINNTNKIFKMNMQINFHIHFVNYYLVVFINIVVYY